MSMYLRKHNLGEVYSYIDITLRMILCTPSTNCSSERSFSTLKRVKSYLGSISSEERFNSLAIFNIESDLTKKLDYKKVIEEFVHKNQGKSR